MLKNPMTLNNAGSVTRRTGFLEIQFCRSSLGSSQSTIWTR